MFILLPDLMCVYITILGKSGALKLKWSVRASACQSSVLNSCWFIVELLSKLMFMFVLFQTWKMSVFNSGELETN